MDIRQEVLDRLSYGLYVVTSHCDGKLNGQISDALMQVTAFPPRVAVSINKDELTHEYISKSAVFAVSILSRSADMPFIGLFGFKSGRDVDKLSQIRHKIGRTGCPLVTENAVAAFEAEVRATLDLDTHTLFVADVVAGEVIEEARILTYRYYTDEMKGKVPKNSPSYHGGAPPAVTVSHVARYVCDICGYVYDPQLGDPDNGVAPGTAFEDLPEDWVCPVCGAGREAFSPAQ